MFNELDIKINIDEIQCLLLQISGSIKTKPKLGCKCLFPKKYKDDGVTILGNIRMFLCPSSIVGTMYILLTGVNL